MVGRLRDHGSPRGSFGGRTEPDRVDLGRPRAAETEPGRPRRGDPEAHLLHLGSSRTRARVAPLPAREPPPDSARQDLRDRHHLGREERLSDLVLDAELAARVASWSEERGGGNEAATAESRLLSKARGCGGCSARTSAAHACAILWLIHLIKDSLPAHRHYRSPLPLHIIDILACAGWPCSPFLLCSRLSFFRSLPLFGPVICCQDDIPVKVFSIDGSVCAWSATYDLHVHHPSLHDFDRFPWSESGTARNLGSVRNTRGSFHGRKGSPVIAVGCDGA